MTLAARLRICCNLLLIPLLLSTSHADTTEEEWTALSESGDSNPQQAAEDAKQALLQARRSGDEKAEMKAIVQLSLESWDSISERELERGNSLAHKFGDMTAQCLLLWRKAGEKEQLGGAGDTPLFDAALLIAEQNHLKGCEYLIRLSKSYMFRRQGRKSAAMEWLSKAYTIAEVQGDKHLMAAPLLQIAALLSGAEVDPQDLPKAMEYYQRAFALIDPRVQRASAHLYYIGMGSIYFRLKNLVQAQSHLEKALDLARELRADGNAAWIKLQLGEVAKAEGRFADALAYLDDALRILPTSKAGDSVVWLVQALLARAEVLAQLGRGNESQETLVKAQKALQEADSLRFSVIYYSRAAAVYAQLGNYAEAYRQMRLLWEANERFTTAANATLADQLKVRFDVQLKESENALLRVQNQEAEARRIALLLALALSLLLLGGLAFWLRRRAVTAKIEVQHHRALATASAAASQAKSTFLSNMSHELRSPLNAMLGFTRLLMHDASLSAEARNDLGIVLKSGEHLYSLINQVLDLSKIEAGATVLQEKDLALHELVDELADMFALIARDKGVQLIIDCPAAVPHYIHVDAVKLRQVLINLLSNAFKFTFQGSVTLRILPAPVKMQGGQQSPSCRLSFSVIDTGYGIAADELLKLGNAFVQAQAGQQAKEGTGLGLAISRSFVQLMGSELRLTSEVGKGTTLTFDLTVNVVEGGETIAAVGASRRVVGLAPDQPRYRILAVDDREEGRQLLIRLLTPLGFDVREASNGEEAIAVWNIFDPHLIWMDMRMPVMDGREATRRIKGTEKGKATIIIALTASSFDEEREEILAAGCNDFIRKPFQEERLFEVMRKHLGLTFIYENEPTMAAPALTDTLSLASLPAELRAELKRALTHLDTDAIDQAIEAIGRHDAALAQALAAAAKKFHYGWIHTLLDDVMDQP